jgi:pimeloyl-ACP methyl ester carboxylesterase
MSVISKPTIVLVHGAYHRANVWDRVIADLTAKGFRCVAPQMCFCGTDEPVRAWQTCIDQLQAVLRDEVREGRNVVVVNHSLGGIGGCSAVRGFTERDPSLLASSASSSGRVVGIVQVTAIALKGPEHKREFYENLPSIPYGDGWKAPPPNAQQYFYNDLDPSDAEHWASQLLPNSRYLDTDADGVYPGFWDVPVWYLRCTRDMAFVPAHQDRFIKWIQEDNPDVTIRELDASHSPMLSRPKETARVIREAAEAFSPSH